MTVPAERGSFAVTEIPVRQLWVGELFNRTGGERLFADEYGPIVIVYEHAPGLQVVASRPGYKDKEAYLSSLTLPDGRIFYFDTNDYCFLRPDGVTFVITMRNENQSPTSVVEVKISQEGFSYREDSIF